MIVQFKDMIARCIARLRQGECESCENRATCVVHAAGAFAPPGNADSPLRALFGQISRALVAAIERPSAFGATIEHAIEARLLAGQPVRIDGIAAELGVSRQTLYRRLRAEGTTFEDLLDRLRHRLALRYLRDERLSVKAAAYRLGFSEPAAFSRAFKRWTGASPSAATA
ncbi:MAG: helix-turn-helix transcriptional regulator [Sphingomicrobium sp.]